MEPGEYEVMYRNEDSHWWYWGLRNLVLGRVRRLGSGRPDAPLMVLDAGCGTGRNLAGLTGWARSFGVELAEEALPFLRDRGLDTVARGSIARLPFADATFDVVVSTDVLCCVPPPADRAAARELTRVLKPGGVLLLNLPAYEWLRSRHDAAVHTRQRFTRSSLVRLLTDAGLDVRHASYRNTILFPAQVLVRAARRLRPPSTARADDHAPAPINSDVAPMPGPINAALKAPLAIENAWLRAGGRLPFGLSLYCEASRPGPRTGGDVA